MGDILPGKITAGLTFQSTARLTAYPAPEWVLTIILRGPQSIDLTATTEGTAHRVNVDAATSSGWAPGEYWYSARVTREGEVSEVECGQITVAPDLTQQDAGYDGRTHAQKVLSAIEAVIEGRASKDQQYYMINNRSLQRTPIGDLLKLRDVYRAQINAEEARRTGNPLGRKILVRF